MASSKQGSLEASALFYALAEDVKTPLVSIAYKAELSAALSTEMSDIQGAAKAALDMIDAYILGIQGINQSSFVLEPVSPSAVITEVAYELKDYAKKFACNVELDMYASGQYAVTNKHALKTALTAVGRVLIDAQKSGESQQKNITISSYKTKQGFALGIFGQDISDIISSETMQRARAQVGKASRPLQGLASGSSAQLFIADHIAAALHTAFRTARRGKLHGLAVDLQPSAQLTLV